MRIISAPVLIKPFLAMLLAIAVASAQPPGGAGRGQAPETGAPIPGQKWIVHDPDRPQPKKVTPGLPIPEVRPPSDAIVLFDGKDLSQWVTLVRGGGTDEPKWKVENGYMEMVPRSGSLATKARFGDIQLHLEWMVPKGADPSRKGQMRGNSGVILMGHYELQVLESFDNPTYADGSAGAIYGLYPPMVNPTRPEGDWNEWDVFFEAPRFSGEKVTKPPYVTLVYNGVLVHNHAELIGDTSILPLAQFRPHGPEEPLVLQGHAGPIRYRNIWLRRLTGYDTR